MSGLWTDFLTNEGRVVHKWSHYFPAYERHFSRYVNRPVLFLEIGVANGGSLQLWKRYLGPYARIVGIDIDESTRFEQHQISVRIGDQKDPTFLQSVLDEFGTPDVILDDGSHIMSDTVGTFDYLYPRMSSSGVYMVEDMHTAYWAEYGGGLREPGSFIEVAKGLIDELNAETSRGVVEPTAFTAGTVSMHFYDSIVVFERGLRSPTYVAQHGTTRPRDDAKSGPRTPLRARLRKGGG